MKIKLAILCPIRRKIAPGGEGKLENKIFTLAQELVKLGVDVTLLAAAGSQSPGSLVAITPDPLGDDPGQHMADEEAMALCEAFAHAGQFDIIHNFFGAAAFPFSIITTTPMISFLDSDPAPAHSAIYTAFSRHMRFVAEAASPGEYILKSSNMEQSDFFGRITVVRQGSAEQTAREYLEVYRQILSKRENYRPWGHYENLAEGEDHKIKRIVVAP
ncbi:MAG: hypothetical protein OEV92_14040, partial [Nitrospinota bacterium]|nr:hypothetical protein [Nitrospinota bacterium]